MSTPAVLIRISTGEVIKHANLPGDPTQPIPGLDSDLKWLIKREPFAAPDYDERYFILNRIETAMQAPHPDYPLYEEWRITYTTTKRPTPEIVDEVKNAEQDALQKVFPARDQLKLLALGIAVLFRAQDGLQLNAKETAIKNKVLNLAQKIWQNDSVARTKETAVLANSEPDLDADWQTEP